MPIAAVHVFDRPFRQTSMTRPTAIALATAS
jgi:hypothetical protein